MWVNEILTEDTSRQRATMNGTHSQLHKGGGTNKTSDQQPVVLLNSVYQLLNYVIIERLKKNVEPANILEPGQGGGRQGRCVGINMQKVHFIRQEAQRQSKRVYRVDIDFKIAFTAMSQAALVEVGKDVASALTCKRCTSSNRKLRDRARKFIESTLTLKTPSPPCLKQRSGRW